MSAGGDFIPGDQAFDAAPDYPVVFGVRMTPTVSGIALGILGLAGAGALMYFLVLPEWEQYQQLKAKVEQTEAEIQQQQATRQKIDAAKKDLETAKQQKQDVLTLFANQSALDTLLLDINRQIDARNADLAKRKEQKLNQCAPVIQAAKRDERTAALRPGVDFEAAFLSAFVAKAELKSYTPSPTKIIEDDSYGSQVKNKLKRQAVSVNLSGNYEQTTAILQNIERLQPLLVIRDLSADLTNKDAVIYSIAGNSARLQPCQADPKLTTTFKLEALLPLTAEEMQQASQTPQKK